MTTPIIFLLVFLFLLFCLLPLAITILILLYAYKHRINIIDLFKKIFTRWVDFYRDIWYNSNRKS